MRKAAFYVLVFALGLGAGFLALSPRAGAHTAVDGTLTGSVGTSSSANANSISLSASSVAPGTYEFDITDYATIHNFDLLGPDGVSIDKTSVAGTGSVAWIVTLSPGVYEFHCDVHAATMHGTLPVTGGTTSTSTTTGASTTSTPTTAATTTAPTTTTTPATTGGGLEIRIASVHATHKLVTVTVAANQLMRAVATLSRKGKRLARTARDGRTIKLRLQPRHALVRGRYVVRVTVTCCGTSKTAKKTIRIR